MEEMNLEEMRNQYAILKEQLNNQEIVNDRLIRETIKMRGKDINYTKKVVYGCALFCLLIYPLSYYTHMWSLAFAIVTCLMMLFCVAATYYIHKPVENLNLMQDDLATVARVMAKFKKQYDNWLHYVTPALLIPWGIWACYEVGWSHAPEGSNPWIMIIPLLVGALIGGLVGYKYHRKAVNAAQDIINDIESI